ncbi:7 transmembrane receptor (rhodopsin family) domain-containing protein [Ditylenchus destructor]|nr:7 transmembrane receptor (rhodopsin family) domain-containing protein [Ditylenchus destructor]
MTAATILVLYRNSRQCFQAVKQLQTHAAPTVILIIINLGIASMALAIFEIPLWIGLAEPNGGWPYPPILCPIRWWLASGLKNVLILLYLALALDPYMRITHRKVPNKTIVYILIALIWCASPLVSIGNILLYEGFFTRIGKAENCAAPSLNEWPWQVYATVTIIVFPFVVLAYCLFAQRAVLRSMTNMCPEFEDEELRELMAYFKRRVATTAILGVSALLISCVVPALRMIVLWTLEIELHKVWYIVQELLIYITLLINSRFLKFVE